MQDGEGPVTAWHHRFHTEIIFICTRRGQRPRLARDRQRSLALSLRHVALFVTHVATCTGDVVELLQLNAYGEKGGSNLEKTSKILKVVIATLYNLFHLLTPDIIKGEEDTDCGLCMRKCAGGKRSRVWVLSCGASARKQLAAL